MTTISDTNGLARGVYTTAGRRVFGGPARRAAAPPNGPVMNVLSRCAPATFPRDAATGIGATSHQRVTVDVSKPVLSWVFHGGFGGTIAEPFVLRAAAGVNGGPKYALTFSGAQQTSVPVEGATMTADPLPVDVLAGDVLDVYTWTQGPKAYMDLSGADSDEGATIHTGSYDPNHPAAAPLIGWGTVRPARIGAPSTGRSWILSGDSIVQVSLSHMDYLSRRLNLASVKVAQGGDYHGAHPGPRTTMMYGPHLATATHMIDELGINQPLPEPALKFWKYMKANGITWLGKTTLAPRSSPSQTPPTEPLTFNTWLRDGAPLTADGSATVAAGTAGAIRAKVIKADGTIVPGSGAHPVDCILDCAAAIEDPNRPGMYTQQATDLMTAAGHTDWLHYHESVHRLVGERLVRDLGILGF